MLAIWQYAHIVDYILLIILHSVCALLIDNEHDILLALEKKNDRTETDHNKETMRRKT